MPYKSDKKGVLIPRELKRNIKLSMEEREEIRLIRALHGYSYNTIARAYGVSKRLVQFICDPEKERINRERRKRLGKDGRYYNREYNKEQVRESRRYKHWLYNNGMTTTE